MRQTSKTLLAAVLALGLGACDEATGPGGDATMQVAARGDDAPASSSTGSTAPAFSQALSGAEGTVDFRARVYAQSSTGSWVELTRRAAERLVVDASGRGEAKVVTTAGVAAGSYNRVRVVFEEVKADVSGGIRIGAGLLTGVVTVDLRSDSQVVVERSVNVDLSGGGSAQLLINLNADAWLSQASAQSHTVSEAAFESAVTVSTY